MEYQKIRNLLGTTLDEVPKFITKKWVEVHDQSGSADDRYQPSKQITFKQYLSNFWKTLDIPLINCEVSLTLTWSESCVFTYITTQTARAAQGDNPARERIDAPTSATFKITDTELYVPVVTLSTKDDNNFLEQLKSGFKRFIKWNKYRSEMTNQTKTNHLNHLMDPTFTKVNRSFVLSFENEESKTSFSKYYVLKVEIKDFNVLIDGKSFLMYE